MVRIILCLVLGLETAHAGLSRLAALSMIESGDNDSVVGEVGEVSRYQIKPWIWKLYSQSEDYRSPVIASYVAEKHLNALEETFHKRARRAPTDFDLYVLWNAGPTYYGRIGFASTRVHPVIKDRARRYANLRQAKNLGPTLAMAPAGNPSPSKTTLAASTNTVQQLAAGTDAAPRSPAAQPGITETKPGLLAIGRMPGQ